MNTVKSLDPVLRLLAALVIISILLMFAASKWFPSDGQTFQVMSGLINGFAGALLMRVKPPEKHEGDNVVTTSTETTIATKPKEETK